MNIETKNIALRVDKLTGLPYVSTWNPSDFWLSQSTMKAYKQHQNGELCGILFRDLCLTRILKTDTSEPAKLGQYFEWLATGSKPAYGDPVPEPERYSINGATWSKGDLKKDWIHPQKQAEAFLAHCKYLGLKIIAAGSYIKRVDKDGNPLGGGNLDIILQVDRANWDTVVGGYQVTDVDGAIRSIKSTTTPTYEQCVWTNPADGVTHQGCIIVDLKFTGMMDTDWNGMGWNIDRLPENDDKMMQAKHYHWLSGGLPFFFWIFDSKNDDDRLIRVFFEAGAIDRHTERLAIDRKTIVAKMVMDAPDYPAFEPQPKLKDCNVCPLRISCKHRATIPNIFGIFVS